MSDDIDPAFGLDDGGSTDAGADATDAGDHVFNTDADVATTDYPQNDPTDYTQSDPADSTYGSDGEAGQDDESITMTIDGASYDAGQATVDSDGDGAADTAVQDHGYQVEYYVDSDGDGAADELTVTDADGNLISHTENVDGSWQATEGPDTTSGDFSTSDGGPGAEQQPGGSPATDSPAGGSSDGDGPAADSPAGDQAEATPDVQAMDEFGGGSGGSGSSDSGSSDSGSSDSGSSDSGSSGSGSSGSGSSDSGSSDSGSSDSGAPDSGSSGSGTGGTGDAGSAESGESGGSDDEQGPGMHSAMGGAEDSQTEPASSDSGPSGDDGPSAESGADDATASTSTTDMTVSIDGEDIVVGEPTLDITGDGVADTVVVESDGNVEYYVDTDQDGVADQIIVLDENDGTLVNHEVYDPQTGEWTNVTEESAGAQN